MALNEGDIAPDFDLETDTGRVRLADLNADGVLKLAAGKKKIVLVRPV